MKIKNILVSGLGVLALTACNDFLEVDAPSSFTNEIVYGSTTQANYALNGVYAGMLSGNSFGNLLYNGLMLNSDVDFVTNSNTSLNEKSPRRFDVNSADGNVEKLWNALYANIESANAFINGMETSGLLNGEEAEKANQMVGEAKVIRAINYYELMCYYGDVPFTTQSSYNTQEFAPDVKSRVEIANILINDLKAAAEKMYSDKTANIESVEHISQEAAYAMIARIALQAGGYSLNHEAGDTKNYKMTRPENYQDYYQIALEYTDKIISAGGHSLSKSYRDFFVDECNFKVAAGDDAIFEIPFAKETSGNFGYAQGPSVAKNTENEAPFEFGLCNGGVRTTAFYRYQFGENDLRKEYVCGMWNYSAQGVPTVSFNFTMNNNKWSKLWCQSGLGKKTEGSTGINFPYIRYADVLLMNAEAENELNGPTTKAKNALKQVRERAFRGADNQSLMVNDYVDALSTKKDFLKAVLDERKWEFAGENMRWKDLVRNNLYAETITYTFLLYLSAAEDAASSAQYYNEVMAHDGIDYQNILPSSVYSCGVEKHSKNPNFPNGSIYQRFILNEDHPASKPAVTPDKYTLTDKYGTYTYKTDKQMGGSSDSKEWIETEFTTAFQKDGTVRQEIYHSLSGYIYGLETGNIYVKNNSHNDVPFNITNTDYPAVRYMLPYPAEVIARSSGKYRQYYGY